LLIDRVENPAAHPGRRARRETDDQESVLRVGRGPDEVLGRDVAAGGRTTVHGDQRRVLLRRVKSRWETDRPVERRLPVGGLVGKLLRLLEASLVVRRRIALGELRGRLAVGRVQKL